MPTPQTSVRNTGLAQQVDTRLRQDKHIDADKITITAEEGSTVILDGTVPDHATKDRAADLAKDTRGVLRVVDRLAIPPSPRIIAAEPAPDAANWTTIPRR